MAKAGFSRSGDGYRVSEYSSSVVPFSLDFAEGNGATPVTFTLPVKAGTLAEKVRLVVTTAFNGTGAALTVGDGDDVDGYFTSAMIAPATAATATAPVVRDSNVPGSLVGGAGGAYLGGKYYAVDDTIDFTWTQGTTATAGVLKGEIHMKQLTDGGVATAANAAT